MFKKLVSLSGIGLLALVGCGGNAETKTFLAEEAQVPANAAENEQFGSDYNGDGVVDGDDNSLFDLANALGGFGFDLNTLLNDAIVEGTILIGVDITSKNFENDNNATASAYLANTADGGAPVFDGTQEIVVGGTGDEFVFEGVTIVNGNLSTAPSDFVFALPIDPANPTLLTLENAILEGTINAEAGIIANGKLSGTINALELAAALPSIADLLNDLIADGTIDAVTAALILGIGDADENIGNNDGIIDVEFDANAGEFVVNELSIVFDLVNGAPVNILGALFRLDLNADGTLDAMGLGIGFSAVGAIRQ